MSAELITKEIQESITKNLPQAVGDTLQARLRQADLDKENLEETKRYLESSRTQARALQEEISGLRKELEAHDKLKDREEAVAKREHDADLANLQVQLSAEISKGEFVRNVAMGLVRNIEYRSSVWDNSTVNNKAVALPGYSNSPGYVGSAGVPETTNSTSNKTDTAS